MPKTGRIKNKLADKLLDLFGEGWSIDPNALTVNRGATRYNDWVSWSGYINGPNGIDYNIHSWNNMTELVKAKKISIVGKIEMINTEIAC